MRQQRREINTPASDHFHQPPHPFFAAGAERGHDAVIADAGGESFIRNLQFAGINAEA